MIRKITKDKPLKILGFTDTHLDHYEAPTNMTFKVMQETIENEKPDMVLFVGDIVTSGYNKERAERFAQMMTDLKTPWALTFGNHEADNPFSLTRSEMLDVFRTSPYCLIPEKTPVLPDGTPVYGEPNFTVALENEAGKVCHKLIFLESGRDWAAGDAKKYGPTGIPERVDDYLKESQIEWYRQEVRKDDCPSMVFCHIPIPEFFIACEEGEMLYGKKREGGIFPRHNSGLFDAMKEEGKSIAFVAGHCHCNDCRVKYQDILMVANRMSGFSSYNALSSQADDHLLQGCTVYTIDYDGNVTFDDIIYEDRYPQYHEDIYAVVRKHPAYQPELRKITKDQPFKILSFTDLHLEENKEKPCAPISMKLLKETIKEEKPDLVIFVGDNVTGRNNRPMTEDFIELMNELKTPWAPVLGNHEGDNPESVTRENMMSLFARSNYCMALDKRASLEDGREVCGDGNYTVNLINDEGKICHQLIFMDGHGYMSPEDILRHCPDYVGRRIYDFLKPDQVEWYKEQIAKVDCPSMVFCHIPLPEYWMALASGKLLSGKTRENICCSYHNSGMFKAMEEGGKTVAYVTGHDHVSDSRILFRGIQLIYNRHSGIAGYNVLTKKAEDRLIQGCSVYTIDHEGQVSYGDIFYEDRFPQYHDEIHAVVRK